MEKFGVVTNEEAFKQATAGGSTCPECGGRNISHRGSLPYCDKCGTRPWETASRADEEEGAGGRPGKNTY